MRKLFLLFCLGPLIPAAACAYTVVTQSNAYMVENTTGTSPSGQACYDFQTRPTCAAFINGLVISTGTLGPGSTNYIQNSANPTISTQIFKVSSGAVTTELTVPNGVLATDAAAIGQLRLKQSPVICTNTSSSATTTTAVFVPTNLNCTITPTSALSTIFIAITSQGQTAALGERMSYSYSANGNNVGSGNGFTAFQNNVAVTIHVPIAGFVTNAPATTSAVTYALTMKSASGNSVSDNPDSVRATMILFEIQ